MFIIFIFFSNNFFLVSNKKNITINIQLYIKEWRDFWFWEQRRRGRERKSADQLFIFKLFTYFWFIEASGNDVVGESRWSYGNSETSKFSFGDYDMIEMSFNLDASIEVFISNLNLKRQRKVITCLLRMRSYVLKKNAKTCIIA